MKLFNSINWQAVKDMIVGHGKATNRAAADYMAGRAVYWIDQFHAIDTGAMRASVGVVDTPGGMQFHVTVTQPYSQWIEFGHLTVNGGTWVAPRPFLRNARDDTIRAYPRIARSVKLARPGYFSEAGGLVGDDTVNLGISFDKS